MSRACSSAWREDVSSHRWGRDCLCQRAQPEHFSLVEFSIFNGEPDAGRVVNGHAVQRCPSRLGRLSLRIAGQRREAAPGPPRWQPPPRTVGHARLPFGTLGRRASCLPYLEQQAGSAAVPHMHRTRTTGSQPQPIAPMKLHGRPARVASPCMAALSLPRLGAAVLFVHRARGRRGATHLQPHACGQPACRLIPAHSGAGPLLPWAIRKPRLDCAERRPLIGTIYLRVPAGRSTMPPAGISPFRPISNCIVKTRAPTTRIPAIATISRSTSDMGRP